MSAFERAWHAFRGVVDDVELDRLLRGIEREHAHDLAEQQRIQMRAPGRSYDASRWNRCVNMTADSIDPEASDEE